MDWMVYLPWHLKNPHTNPTKTVGGRYIVSRSCHGSFQVCFTGLKSRNESEQRQELGSQKRDGLERYGGQALEAMVVKNGVLFPDITISQMQIDVVL